MPQWVWGQKTSAIVGYGSIHHSCGTRTIDSCDSPLTLQVTITGSCKQLLGTGMTTGMTSWKVSPLSMSLLSIAY